MYLQENGNCGARCGWQKVKTVLSDLLYLQIHEHEEHFKRMNEDSLMHAPEFVIKPRSHTVWEKQCVRLHCTVSGWPDPRVVWQVTNYTILCLSSLFFQKMIFIHSIQIHLVFNVSSLDFVLFFSNFFCLSRYKNNVALDPLANPGKYKIESRYSVHSLEINKQVVSPIHST